ncbi:MAG TPA: carboxymuconolactone decarboxylase family protein [Trinickia sp.]|jgi:4-carboxymuconolactone decarboxylase|uniref:carboxymuconolactone decarboxylase family protein n=1 Tax=Trinickia sp. TaxID=2571163 RepID=UPI002C2FDFDB|nr:carboxymuconolactone decarboxylase family protein [Trinickia sp.]HTI18144.1 carboxymuconolactone decarboxylase family protein [Trinickia sp.]
MISRFTLLVGAMLVTSQVFAQERLPTIPPAHYTAEQNKASEEFLAARKTPVFGPFEPMMYSPEVMNQARSMGDYLRFHSSIGNTLSELVILVTARESSQDFEWSFHYPIALKAGISKSIVDAIADGRRPTGMSADEDIVYDFTTEILKNKSVSDATFHRAEQRFGKQGTVDITAIAGYYSFLAMQLNMARYEPKDGPRLPRFPN